MATSVVFIHGLWVHASAWQPWRDLFAEAGYTTEAPGWPGDSETVSATRLNASRVSGHGIQDVTDHYAALIAQLPDKPVVVGHSFGGLVAQKLLAAGLASAAVAIDPAPIKGVKALPFAQIRSALPVLANKANRDRAVSLSRRQFRYGFGNALSRAESDELFRTFTIPGPGRPIFELTGAKKDPVSPAAVETGDPRRGPLLIVGGEKDHTIPQVVARQAAELYGSATDTEFREIPGRGHSLVFDSGWRDVADLALRWLAERVPAAR
ncbi:alpha/beta fold hydrolase [Conyzicola nivalis]|uniref:Alpha/beta hydrolase n=1 Tax=Conyzicola nivalis TaxID=1477021 RepID=A0A916SMF7_9MICO|nr:alpha/beta hydrolase [Conyzicola nivalis]GGB04649.1 alpha/beta hydrolase [Conyzicola nivalis]